MNKLSLIDYLLIKLSQECNEVSHRISKAQLFGLEEIQPNQPFTNAERINQELNDVFAVIELIEDHSETIIKDRDLIKKSKARMLKHMNYSRELGILEEEE